MDYIILIIFAAATFYIGKSLYDLITDPVLSQREKTNLAFVIIILPLAGSMWVYYYRSKRKRTSRSLITK